MWRSIHLTRSGRWIVAVVAFACAGLWAMPAHAQTLFMDFAQGRLPGSYDDCMSRARQALPAEGWNIGGEYGAPVRGGYFVAWQGAHGVILTCDIEPAGGSLFHLTMSGVDEGNRPLIDALIARIQGSTASTGAESRNLAVTINANREVTLNWRDTPGNKTDWVTISAAGSPDSSYGPWRYTDGNRAGTFNAGRMEPGEYEARLYLDWPAGQYNIADRVRFRIQ
jgi:hypothetical protein